MSDMWLWQYSLEIRNKMWKKLGTTWKWTSWFLANEEIHNIMIGDNDPSHKIILNKRKILKSKNLSKRKIYSQKCHKCLAHIFTHDCHAHSSQFNILVLFLHVFRRVLLNRAPSSTELHPTPPSSTQLHSPPPSSFQPLRSSLQHPRQYLNQNIARNCAIFPNLGQKIKSCPFWLKIGTHGIFEVLIPNPDLDLWNFDPKIHFWANLDPKIQKCPLCLKIGARNISRMLI